jgi:hypothetical protein
MVGGFGGDFLLRQRLGLPDTATEVLLDLSALPSDDQRDWLRFVSFACETLGVAPVIGRFTGTPPESRTELSPTSPSSAALSRKLLLNVAQIYIQPRAAPTRVDGYLLL